METENPYLPPAPAASETAEGAAAMPLRDPTVLGQACVALLVLSVVFESLSHLFLTLAPQEFFADQEGISFIVPTIASALAALLGILSSIVYLFWKYRAACNARIVDPWLAGPSPGLAVGGYFIPFANLVIPYRSMKGIIRTTADHIRGVGLWWLLYLAITGMAFGIAFGEGLSDNVFAEPGAIHHAYMLASIIWTILASHLVLGISRSQRRLISPGADPATPELP